MNSLDARAHVTRIHFFEADHDDYEYFGRGKQIETVSWIRHRLHAKPLACAATGGKQCFTAPPEAAGCQSFPVLPITVYSANFSRTS